jgi:hypothetical protein
MKNMSIGVERINHRQASFLRGSPVTCGVYFAVRICELPIAGVIIV